MQHPAAAHAQGWYPLPSPWLSPVRVLAQSSLEQRLAFLSHPITLVYPSVLQCASPVLCQQLPASFFFFSNLIFISTFCSLTATQEYK